MKTILVDAINCLVLRDGSLFIEMHEMLETFPNRKIVLTSANDDQFKQFNLDQVPYDIFTLKHNPEKTDPKYFQILLKKYKLKADDVVLFDHNPEVIKCTDSLGIKSYMHNITNKNLKELKDFIKSNI